MTVVMWRAMSSWESGWWSCVILFTGVCSVVALVEAFSVIAKTDGLFAALDKSQEQEIGVLFVGFGFLFLGC